VRARVSTRAHACTGARTQTATQRYGPRFPRLKQGLSELTAVTVVLPLVVLVALVVLVGSSSGKNNIDYRKVSKGTL
jgi:hypothetical protein